MNKPDSEDLCTQCRLNAGWNRRDDGYHTAVRKQCFMCFQIKPILPALYWVKFNRAV